LGHIKRKCSQSPILSSLERSGASLTQGRSYVLVSCCFALCFEFFTLPCFSPFFGILLTLTNLLNTESLLARLILVHHTTGMLGDHSVACRRRLMQKESIALSLFEVRFPVPSCNIGDNKRCPFSRKNYAFVSPCSLYPVMTYFLSMHMGLNFCKPLFWSSS
jgi:hypothetical protein